MFRLAVFLCLAVTCSFAQVTFHGDKVFRISTPTESDVENLFVYLEVLTRDQQMEIDIWVEPLAQGFADIHVKKDDLESFSQGVQSLGLSSQVFIDDLQVSMDKQLASKSDEWFEAYHPLADLDRWLIEIVNEYSSVPGLNVRLFTLGQSTQNRTIYGIEFHGTNPQIDIFWNGGHHAREWIGPATTNFLIHNLLSGYGSNSEITSLVNGINFHIVPVLNVDGYEYTWTTNRNWRKTRSTYNNGLNYGVDPNRNWDFQWGGTGSSGAPSSDIYRGPSAFSEPEAQAAGFYVRDLPNCVGYIDWHSYGQYILSAWGYTATLPPDVGDHLRVGNAMEAATRAVNGNGYRVGPSGATLYPTSGSAPDYTYANGVKYSYTIELPGNPGGFQLPPQFILPVGEESLAGALVFSRMLLDESL